MLIAGHLLLESPTTGAHSHQPSTCVLQAGWLRVGGESEAESQIVDFGFGRPPGDPDLGEDALSRPASAPIICPGFVDTHLHLPQFDSIGADGLELLPWLERVIFPAEARWADPDYAGQMALRVARKLLAHGTVAVAAYGTVHHLGTRAAIEALGAEGLAGVVGQVLMDQQAPVELVRPAKQLLSEAAEMRGIGRIGHAVTPRFAVSCSDELLRGAGELARATGSLVQTHLSETRDECDLVHRLHQDSTSYVGVYQDAGLLGPRTLLGHGIWLDNSDRQILAETGSVVAHCPTANVFLQAGLMSLHEHSTRGVRVSLGSDVAGGPDVAMPRVARAMIDTAKLHRLRGAAVPIPSAAQAWWRITAGNADAIGLTETGRIRRGAIADLVVLQPGRGPAGDPEWYKAVDPLGALLYGWDPRWISHTIAAGRVVYSA